MEADLRRQRKQFERAGYDGHQHKAVGTSLRDLRHRRQRRNANRRLRLMTMGSYS